MHIEVTNKRTYAVSMQLPKTASSNAEVNSCEHGNGGANTREHLWTWNSLLSSLWDT